MAVPLNQEIGSRLEETAVLLAKQGANHFRVAAYRRAGKTLSTLPQPVSEIYARDGLAGLEQLPGVGPTIAHAIRDLLLHGRLGMLDRLRGEHDPIALLRSVPAIGKTLAWRLHEGLGIDSLSDLQAAAYDGRLETFPGLGPKRLTGIRDSLAQRLGRIRRPGTVPFPGTHPPVEELLDVDREFRSAATAGTLPKIHPRTPGLFSDDLPPVLHTTRGPRHYTALFSATPRARQLKKTRDWVLLHHDGENGERHATVITAEFGRLKGLRIVPGREGECEDHYRRTHTLPEPETGPVSAET